VRSRSLAAALLAALVLAGCGGGEETATERSQSPELSPTPPTATAPSAPAPPKDIPAPTPTPSPTPASPEEQEGGAGDEEAARLRVDLTIDGEGITPPAVTVTPFLALEFVIRNATTDRQAVRFRGRSRTVAAGRIGRLRAPGLRPGANHVLRAGAAGEVQIIGGAPG
jgi:hypothetical protein